MGSPGGFEAGVIDGLIGYLCSAPNSASSSRYSMHKLRSDARNRVGGGAAVSEMDGFHGLKYLPPNKARRVLTQRP